MKEYSRIGEKPARTNWRQTIAAYTEPRVLQVLALGFSSGLPLLLTYSTLSAWLATAGVKRPAIGAFALVGTPYAFKFLWAPLMDRVPPPLPLGRRRGWGITIQIPLIGAILGLGLCDPKHNLPLMAALALLVAFLSASQDIVIDAWRVESMMGDRQAPGAAMIGAGYRVGMLVSGAGGLLIAARAGWFAAYATMAALLGVGFLVFLLGPEPKGAPAQRIETTHPVQTTEEAPSRKSMTAAGVLMVIAGVFSLGVPGPGPIGLGLPVTVLAFVAAYGGFAGKRRLALWCAQVVAWVTFIAGVWVFFDELMSGKVNIWAMMISLVVVGGVACVLALAASAKLVSSETRQVLSTAVIGPFRDFMRRPLWPVILIAIFGYKLGEAMAGVMSTPLYISLGFSLPEIAAASKIFGFFSIVAGALLGGVVTTRYGIRRSLILCGILQAAGNLFFVLQAVGGHRIGYLALCVTAENITGGMAMTALVTYLSSLCSPAFTATQYALLSSLTLLGRTVVASSGGFLSEKTGWPWFFLLTSVISLPAIALFLWIGPRNEFRKT